MNRRKKHKTPGRLRQAAASALEAHADRLDVVPGRLALVAGAVAWAVVGAALSLSLHPKASAMRWAAARLCPREPARF